ncbi:MAG: hypothetical protein D4R68_08505 [Ignavibacteriales bacterium]|nr:MAG: hypothetical protein D4R68_08505 [Ignavibacteriales bacterium]
MSLKKVLILPFEFQFFNYKRIIRILIITLLLMNVNTFSQQFLIAVEDDAAPWSQKDGTGYANDVVTAAFKAVGSDIKLLVVPYARGKEMVISGKIVACFSMSWVPELEGEVVFPKIPLFTCYVDYFARKEDSLNIKKEEDLKKGTVVGIVIDYEYPHSAYKLRDKGILIFDESESEELNLKKLALGRINFALITHNETKPSELLIARAGAKDKVINAFRCGSLSSYIGFSTKHQQGTKALEEFNRGMQIISSNGSLRKIGKKWKEIALSEIDKLTEEIKK